MRERWRAWRRTPRGSVLELSRVALMLPLFVGTAWLVVADAVRSLATGRPTPAGLTGPAAALYALAALAFRAAPGTVVGLAWLRRPRPGPPADPPAPAELRDLDAGRVRQASERAAWRSRP